MSGRRTVRPLAAWALTLAGVMAIVVGALAAGVSASASTGHPKSGGFLTVHHVFVIVLENESSSSTFADPSADPYLAQTLVSEGAYLPNYEAVGHASNDNYVAMVSGQPPNALNQSDCVDYVDFVGVVLNGIDQGEGCVYPSSIATIGSQLTAAGYSWKGYEGDMGNVPSREAAACGHPTLNGTDGTQSATAGDGYATRHDPWVYFHTVIDDQTYCDAHVVALGSPAGAMPAGALPGETGLAQDLRSVETTPNLSFITPNLCDDGHDYPCTNQPSGPSALADIDAFLQTWVPRITSSPAFKKDGLLEITFDEGAESDTAACCGETPGVGGPLPGLSGPGGGTVGAVLLSPFIAPGTKSTIAYNHYSGLASFEAMFGLSPLGEAVNVTQRYGWDVFTDPSGRCVHAHPVPWQPC